MKFVTVKRGFDKLEEEEKSRVLDGLLRWDQKLRLHFYGCMDKQCRDKKALLQAYTNCRRYVEGRDKLGCSTSYDRMHLVRCTIGGPGGRVVMAGTELRSMFDRPSALAKV